MKRESDVSMPLMETLKAINSLRLYTPVVRNRSEFLPRFEEKIRPRSADRLPAFFWLTHNEMCQPPQGRYAELLQALMMRSGIASRRFAAASFLLRYGWSSGAMIAAALMNKPIPTYAAEEAELCFAANTLFQAICLQSDSFATAKGDVLSAHEHCLFAFQNKNEAISLVAQRLLSHAKPIVERLHEWSRFSYSALWAMVSSSWVGQIINISKILHLSEEHLNFYLRGFYGEWHPIACSLPHCYHICELGKNHYFHIRAACCLYFKGKERHFCASCPLLNAEERLDRNRHWVREYS